MPRLDDGRLIAAREALRPLIAEQGGVFTVAQAVAAGLTPAHIATLVRRGSWLSIRRGVLAEQTRANAQPHLVACAAKLLATGPGVISHLSAASLHGFQFVDPPSEPVITVPWTPETSQPFGALLSLVPEHHRAVKAGLEMTSRERTLIDVLRTAPDRLAAQALADGAAATGIDVASLGDVMTYCSGWPGIVQAREAWTNHDARSESPLESRCRVWIRDAHLPASESQVRICDETGEVIARVDFLFREQRTVLEADGRVKYVDPTALWDEKRREDRLRSMGFEVVRATWADGEDHGAALVRRLHQAFARSQGRRAA